jgi:FlaA1/EpsC-like NDP-sugar epimerase
MARALIKLTAPEREDRDIPIEFIGMRPGEKLYEELVADDETLERASPLEPVGRIRAHRERSTTHIAELIAELEAAAKAGDEARVAATIRELVPTFRLVPPVDPVTVAVVETAEETDAEERVLLEGLPELQPLEVG